MPDIAVTSEQIDMAMAILIIIEEKCIPGDSGMICLLPELVEQIKDLVKALKSQNPSPHLSVR